MTRTFKIVEVKKFLLGGISWFFSLVLEKHSLFIVTFGREWKAYKSSLEVRVIIMM